MKQLENERQSDFMTNCYTVITLMKERQKEQILEQIIQMDEVVQAILMDVKAAKGLRAQLFHREQQQNNQQSSSGRTSVNNSALRSGPGSHRGSVPSSYTKKSSAESQNNKSSVVVNGGKDVSKDVKTTLMPVFFHLLENLISNVNVLVENYSNNLLSQCPNEVKDKVSESHPPDQFNSAARNDKTKKTVVPLSTKNSEKKEDKKEDEVEKVYLKLEPEKNSKKLLASKKRIDSALEAMLSYVNMSKDIANKTQKFE